MKKKIIKAIGFISLVAAVLLLYLQIFRIFYSQANISTTKNISISNEIPPDMSYHQIAALDTNSISLEASSAESEYQNLHNYAVLKPFFEKLNALETFKDRKLNIVHIGDSHIQSDAMTNLIRQRFQERFGNAGLGFVFPYSLMRTNGGRNIRFSSNISWDNQRITEAKNFSNIGLSGYSFTTNKKNFLIEIEVQNKKYSFNTLKIITPNNQQSFELATNQGSVALKPSQPKTISHKIQKGETLYAIAKKYKTTVAKIQSANNLKSNKIIIGATLKIPTTEIETKPINLSEFNILTATPKSPFSYYMYENLEVSDKIYLTPNPQSTNFTLNGIVLENNQSGIIYHNIGVNGVHLSDYNKSKLFFEQLKALEPDLIIISLGTNETFGRVTPVNFHIQIEKFIEAIRNNYGQAPMILTSPPPSLLRNQSENSLVAEYAETLTINSFSNNYAAFNLFKAMGGQNAMQRLINLNLIAKDRIHYTANGYEEQGALFFESLMNNYEKSKIIY
ncbi:MAG: LysM peptidoglycan-binding domain-containing protein [Capnocytophaga sp.]|nr:LysM peptidoglycan-binding domain-containing protein [Capnocytophaga sp.]